MRIKAVPAIVALVAGSFAGYLAISVANASTPAPSAITSAARDPKVESLIRDGLLAQLKVGSDPDLLDSTVRPAPPAEALQQAARSSTRGRSAEAKAKIQTKWTGKLSDLTTAGPLRDRLTAQVDLFNQNVDESYVDLGGGISAFNVSASKETPDQLVIDGSATVWNASSQVQNGNVVIDEPSTDIVFHVVLAPAPSSKAGWVLSDLTTSFAHGTAP